FYLPRAPAPLRPSPTRRSSDLAEQLLDLREGPADLGEARAERREPEPDPVRLPEVGHDALLPQPGADLPRARVGDRHVPAAALEDRKSTRLNSSHVSISYAVFC